MSGKTKLTNMNPIIQTVLDAHFPGMAKPVVMDEDDRWAFAIAELRAEVRNLRAENAALRNYLERAGWGPCNAAACNCNGWHKVRASRDEIELEAKNAALQSRLETERKLAKEWRNEMRQSLDVRAIVGELRAILATDSACGIDGERLRDLLRRLEEPQTGE